MQRRPYRQLWAVASPRPQQSRHEEEKLSPEESQPPGGQRPIALVVVVVAVVGPAQRDRSDRHRRQCKAEREARQGPSFVGGQPPDHRHMVPEPDAYRQMWVSRELHRVACRIIVQVIP